MRPEYQTRFAKVLINAEIGKVRTRPHVSDLPTNQALERLALVDSTNEDFRNDDSRYAKGVGGRSLIAPRTDCRV